MDITAAAHALCLLILANFAPWVAGRLLRGRGAYPLDFGCVLRDGRPLFGAHKTWRGLFAGTTICAATSPMLGLPWTVGAGAGLISLLGDALSSGIKRRLGLAPGAELPGLDQLPEALLPLLLLAKPLGLDAPEIALVALVFTVFDLSVSRWRRAPPQA